MSDRTCSDCGVSKPLDDFPKDSKATGGRRSCCKRCHSAANKRRYDEDPTIRLRKVAARRARELADPEAARARAREQYERHRERRLAKQSAYTQTGRARRLGVAVDACIDRNTLRRRDGDQCHYCQTTMSFVPNIGRQFRPDLATIDHIVPLSRGGAHDWINVVLACWGCNVSKKDRTPEEWQPASA
jgi:5-methylcytosine-specific restriction endonuclease McrA